MKILLFIVGLVILGLGCLPCGDHSVQSQIYMNSDNTISASDQPTKNFHLDFCSPFCSCSCCSTIIVSSKIAAINLKTEPFVISYTDGYRITSIMSVALPIWQPPQLNA